MLHSFEVNEEYETVIRRHLAMAKVSDRVILHTKDYYDLLVPRMRRGGLVIVDNVLWGRKVLDLEQNKDADTRCMHAFNEYVQADKRVENILLNVRDGLLICSVL